MANPLRQLMLQFLSSAAVLLCVVACGSAAGQTIRMGTETGLDAMTARQGALGPQLAYVPITFEIARDGHVFSVTAPHQHVLTERTAFVSEPATHGRLTSYGSETRPTDLAAVWHHRRPVQADPSFTVGYTARARFDTAVADASLPRARSEYLLRADLEREVGRFTPRVEFGYRYAPHTALDSPARPRVISAVDTTFHHSERSSFELFFDQRASLEGGVAEREVSLAWTQRTSNRSRLVLYAVKSVSDGWVDAGVKLSTRF